LGLPADVLNGFRQGVDPRLEVLRHLGRVAVRPRAFDQRAAGAPVAGFCNASLPTCRATGVLGGNQPDEGGELARRVEPREGAELGDDRDRHEELHPTQGLQRPDHRIKSPGRHTLEQLGLEAGQPIDLFIDRAHGLLKHDLLRRRRADHFREVATMRVVPIGPPHIVPAQSEQEGFQPELGVLERNAGGVPGSTQIADRFVIDRRHVDARERNSRANSTASRRSVLTLSPGFLGMSEGATT
jgi:hypothetical protein